VTEVIRLLVAPKKAIEGNLFMHPDRGSPTPNPSFEKAHSNVGFKKLELGIEIAQP
jgi:hypothetical protein